MIGPSIPYQLDAQETRAYVLGLLAGGIISTVSAINLTSALDFVEAEDSTASLSLMPRIGIASVDTGELGAKPGMALGGSLLLTL